MSRYIFLGFLFFLVETSFASPPYLECSPYKQTLLSTAEAYTHKVPHYSVGYQFWNLSVLQQSWRNQKVCVVTYTRYTDSCDDYLYRTIYVDPLSSQVVYDRYTNSVWCGY